MKIRTSEINSVTIDNTFYSPSLMIDINEDEDDILNQISEDNIIMFARDLTWNSNEIQDLFKNNLGEAEVAITTYFTKEPLQRLIENY